MIFHKYETERGYVINEVYDDEFVTYCADCGTEIKLEPSDIAQILKGGDFSGTIMYCHDCSERRG